MGEAAGRIPNLTHLQPVLYGHFAPQIFSVHRFPLMHAEILRKTLEDAGRAQRPSVAHFVRLGLGHSRCAY